MSCDSSRSDPVALCVVADADLRASIRETLAALDLRIVECADAEEALRTVREGRPAIVITSARVAGLDEFLEECAGDGSASRVPWIQVGTSAECQSAAAIGAEDWIVAPVIGPLLAFRVERVLRSARMERELVELRGETSFGEASAEAVISGPTPRERFLLRADGILRSPRQRRLDAAVLVVSVELGSTPSDDEVIPRCQAALGRRLRDVVRAREGNAQAANAPATLLEGREFTLLLERQERVQESYKIARRIQQQLERPLDIGGEQVEVQVNIGIAVHLKDGTSATELCDVARRAMTGARQEQLHGIRFATGEMNSIMFERLALESSLRYALERNELVLFYQPRIDIRSCSIVGFEALVRWKHPELGMVSPGQFIPIAEESGLIVPIGEWVMREACRQNQAWRAAGLPHVRMAVNLSSVQFRQPDLELSIARVLEETGLDPSGLELELTESLLLQDADATIETLRTIKHMGIHMSIDDFGTGYSSLSYVKRFPVNALKIDQSFIRDVTTSPEDSAITTSIILMGKSLGLTVVAEGVETKSQLEFLRVLECDEAQGYLFSRPVPAKEAGDCLAAGYSAMVSTAA